MLVLDMTARLAEVYVALYLARTPSLVLEGTQEEGRLETDIGLHSSWIESQSWGSAWEFWSIASHGLSKSKDRCISGWEIKGKVCLKRNRSASPFKP